MRRLGEKRERERVKQHERVNEREREYMEDTFNH
jgi:hypothetical protein